MCIGQAFNAHTGQTGRKTEEGQRMVAVISEMIHICPWSMTMFLTRKRHDEERSHLKTVLIKVMTTSAVI